MAQYHPRYTPNTPPHIGLAIAGHGMLEPTPDELLDPEYHLITVCVIAGVLLVTSVMWYIPLAVCVAAVCG